MNETIDRMNKWMNEWTNEWMNEWQWMDEWPKIRTNEQMNGQMNGWLDEDGLVDAQMSGRTNGQMDGWVDGWTDEWMDGRMGRRMNGWMDRWMVEDMVSLDSSLIKTLFTFSVLNQGHWRFVRSKNELALNWWKTLDVTINNGISHLCSFNYWTVVNALSIQYAECQNNSRQSVANAYSITKAITLFWLEQHLHVKLLPKYIF